jgi:hypothetical protein
VGIENRFVNIKKIFYDNTNYKNSSEHDLRDKIIFPIIKQLDWRFLTEESKKISGQITRLDATLFSNEEYFSKYSALSKEIRYSAWDGIDVILETKGPAELLDTKKVSKLLNPYYQLLYYMQSSKINHGFLVNGDEWMLIDNTYVSAEKRYISFDLKEIIDYDDLQNFEYFYSLFHAESFRKNKEGFIPIKLLNEMDQKNRIVLEENLKELVYGSRGQYSIFEDIGRNIYTFCIQNDIQIDLDNIYENSLYFIFRIIFIAYFEDKHKDTLESHPYYTDISLWKLSDEIVNSPQKLFSEKIHSWWFKLRDLFSTLDSGNSALMIPLLDGGLFNSDKATLLKADKLFNNASLSVILRKILYYESDALRDFSAFSPSHLGSIYEGLIEYQFKVADDILYYVNVNYKQKSSSKNFEGYLDFYDYELIRKNKEVEKCDILNKYEKGDFYLTNSLKSKKLSGSYYTPESLSRPLAERAIQNQLDYLASKGKNSSILDLRILDNACGSGHILIEALNICALKAQENINHDKYLEDQLETEIVGIKKNLEEIGCGDIITIDEFTVLKRILLKRVIYGVDISPFAVELTQLSLWIDTFIFGTPLSFIEHHIKVGNSLIGTTKKYLSFGSKQLFYFNIQASIEEMMKDISDVISLNDLNKDDLEQSKIKYKEISDNISKINKYFNIVNCTDLSTYYENTKNAFPAILNANNLFEDTKLLNSFYETNSFIYNFYLQNFKFFNWEVEFPEIFNHTRFGFNIIIGNPPWDKIKFEDPLFFSQFRSNYRSLSESEKDILKKDLLNNKQIEEQYEDESRKIFAINEYLSNKFPYNKGSGDGNYFRFFVERNLSLLAEGGSLNYILPTALLTEDGSTNLRSYIFKKFKINYFEGFENRKKLFSNVDSRYKFGLIQIQNIADDNQIIKTRFMVPDPNMLENNNTSCMISLSDIKTLSPNHLAFLEMPDGSRDLQILKKLYDTFLPLDVEWLDFRRELDATNDKKLFREKHNQNSLPLYKGEMIWQYNPAVDNTTNQYWVNIKDLHKKLTSIYTRRMVSDIIIFSNQINDYRVLKEGKISYDKLLYSLNLTNKTELEQFLVYDHDFFRLGFRAIARDTDERSMIVSLLPKNIAAQNSLWLSIPGKYEIDFISQNILFKPHSINKLMFAQAIFNSLIYDWVLRMSIAMNVNKTFVMRIPFPQPNEIEFSTNFLFKDIIRKSASLNLYNYPEGFEEIKKELKLNGKDEIKTNKHYDKINASLDVAVAKLYDINFEEFKYIVSSFRVLNNKKPEFVAELLHQAKSELDT